MIRNTLLILTVFFLMPASFSWAGQKASEYPRVHQQLDSYEKIREFITFMDDHVDQTVSLKITVAPPFAGKAWASCGPLLWENPEHFTGTQICFQGPDGDFTAECFQDPCPLPRGYDNIGDRITIQGIFTVLGQIDRGRHGIWTYGLNFRAELPARLPKDTEP